MGGSGFTNQIPPRNSLIEKKGPRVKECQGPKAMTMNVILISSVCGKDDEIEGLVGI